MKQKIHPDYHPVVFRDRGELRLPHQVDRDQRANHHLGGRKYLSRHRRRDLLGEPPVLHRAGARPRHRRAGGAVPPPVWQQGHGRLTASGGLCPPAITGRPTLEPGGPFPCPHLRFTQAGNSRRTPPLARLGVGFRIEPSVTPLTRKLGSRRREPSFRIPRQRRASGA